MKSIWLIICAILIFLILLRIPNNTGLESKSNKTSFLGSTTIVDKFLDIVMWFGIILYMLIAIELNLSI